jgi:hypothetical protein
VVFAGVRAAWSFLLPAWRRGGLSLVLASGLVGLALAHGRSVWTGLAALAVLNAAAALLPLALGESQGPGLLARGASILRLAGMAALSALFLFILGLLAFVLILCFAYAAAASGHGFVGSEIATWAPAVDDRGRVVVTTVALACALGLAWAALRISLAAPATVATGKVQVLAAWPLTRGKVLSLAAGFAAVSGPPAILALSLEAARAASGAGPLPLALAEGLVIGALWLPLKLGLMGYLYGAVKRPQPPSPVSAMTPIAAAPT